MIGGQSRRTARPAAIRPVEPGDMAALRSAWGMSFDVELLDRALQIYPGRSVWDPGSREVVTVTPWRHRHEIAAVTEIRAIREPEALVARAADRCQALGARAIVCMEWESSRNSAFYDRIGFSCLDTVVSYELSGRLALRGGVDDLTFGQLSLDEPSTLVSVTDLDHEAFPWLWQNNETEFLRSWHTPGTDIWGARCDSVLVGYVSFTHFTEWGHVDRLAVHPDMQGQGVGRLLLQFAVERIRRAANLRVVLSTQRSNTRSQSLYEMLGFRPTGENAYHIYGRLFGERSG